MNKWILICCLGALVSACGGGEQTASDTKTESAPTQAPPSSQVYPSLPVQRLEELWQVCDYIDFVFYNTNFSMNQSEQASIQKTLRHVAAEVPDIKPECKAVGHLFYQSKGRILLEAGYPAKQDRGWTPLHEAALTGRSRNAALLISAGAPVDVREPTNQGTPLHVAGFNGHLEVVKVLVGAGAKVDARDRDGWTAAANARDQGFPNIVKF